MLEFYRVAVELISSRTSLFQDQQRTSDPVRSNISYSPSTLRNYAVSGSGFSPPCPELKRRLQNLGIFRTLNANLARSTVKPIPIISRPRQARNGRKISNNNAARSRNLNNCVILSLVIMLIRVAYLALSPKQ